jgi:hypothetical protein
MKKLIVTVLCFVIALTAFSQEKEQRHFNRNDEVKTIFNTNELLNGYYIGLNGGYTQVDGKDALVFGIKGAYLLNHNLALGLAGNIFADPNDNLYYKDLKENVNGYLRGGYGGLLIEPILMPKQPIHIAFPIIIGGGSACYINEDRFDDDWEWNWNDDNDDVIDDDAFFVVEPGVEVQMNVLKFMRFSVGASYRVTSGNDLIKSDDDFLNGFSTNASLRFGKF